MEKEPLRKIVGEGHENRGPAYHILECGHQVGKEWGRKYGKSRRCFRCPQAEKAIKDIGVLIEHLSQARQLLIEGKFINEGYYVVSQMSALDRMITKQLEREDSD